MKISIITICFNSGKYLERAINSVLIQDYKHWEHIVIDGGSKDGTLQILSRHKHIKWISETDKGQSDAMNKGFNKSTGDIIIFLNADDELNPGLFSVVIEHYKENPNTDILVFDLLTLKPNEEVISKPSTSLMEILRCENPKFPLNPVSYAYKRSLQAKIGKFPIDNHYSMDYWFLIRAYLFGEVGRENFVSGKFYFDGKNKSANWINALASLKKDRREFLLRYFLAKPVIKYNVKQFRTRVHWFLLSLKKRIISTH